MTHHDAIVQFAKMLANLDSWLDKAAAYAKAKPFEVDVLAPVPLAPDQYALVQQVHGL